MIDEKIERIARFKEGNKEFLLTGEVGGEWVAAIGNKSQYVAIGEIVTYGDDGVEFMASGPSPSAALSALLVAITGGSTKDDPITTVKMTGSTVATPHSKKENGMNFGQAIEALKAGMKVARAGWNGKGMFLIFVPGTPNVVPREGSPYASVTAAAININPHIDMKTATGEMQPGWLASQTDMLAEDWEVVS